MHPRVAFLPLVRLRLKCSKPKDYPHDPKIIGEHLKKRRHELGLTQRQAAAVLGVNPWTVINWESEHFQPPIRSMPAVLRFLGYYPFPEPATIGELLLRVRRERGWSTGQAASLLGVDRTTWQDWEAGGLFIRRSLVVPANTGHPVS